MASKPKNEESKTDVATTAAAGLPANVLDAMAQYAGQGISDKMEDNIVPLVYLLQANSKPALEGHEKYVPGAKGGSIWLRNEPNGVSILDGKTGMVFQPCHFETVWLEWAPNRGGLRGRHKSLPKEAAEGTYEDDKGNERKGMLMPNGNILNESREFAGFVEFDDGRPPLMYTVPLSGSGHTVGKSWMTSMRAERLPDGRAAPSFGFLYRLTTFLKTQDDNSWYMYKVEKIGPVTTVEQVKRGAALFAAFNDGVKTSGTIEDIDDSAKAGVAEDVM